MIGPDFSGHFWTIFVREDDVHEGRWRAVTGRQATTPSELGGSGAEMNDYEGAPEEALARAEGEGEWEERPTRIESRPTGTQVVSARLPTVLAEELLAEAARRDLKLSDLVR